MDKLLKVSIIVAVLLAGFGVFYHYVIYLPQLERKKEERAAQEKREAASRLERERAEAAKREEDRQAAYAACLQTARLNYEGDWANACKTAAELQASRLRTCLSDTLILNNPYMGKKYCYSTYGASNPSPSCSLPMTVADSLNKAFKDARQSCLAEAKSGL